MINLWDQASSGDRAAMIVLDVVVKATVLMAIGFLCHAALGRGRALVRSALWNACLVGLLLLPAASAAFPRVSIPVLPGPARAGDPIPIAAPRWVEPVVAETAPPVAAAPRPPADTYPAVAAPSPSPPPARLSAVDALLGLYLAIVILMIARLALALGCVARLKRNALALDDERWSSELEHWRKWLNVRHKVKLATSDRVSVPVVVGWRAPVILLPEALVAASSPGLIDAVLLHELGHVKRGDFAWNVMRKLVQIVYWPHPLAWLVGRVVGAVREQACDDLCVHALGGSAVYRATLAEVAAGLVRRPESALGLAMARSTNLGRRLEWIDRTPGMSRCLLGWPGRLMLALAVAGAAGTLGALELARASAQDAARAASEPPAAIEITIRGKDTGKPLAGARVRPSIDLAEQLFKTDREGRVRIDLSKRMFTERFTFDVWADGYVQQRFYFFQNDPRYPKTPDRFTVELLPGEETLGGKVVDEQGRPIAGVKVEIWGYLGEKKVKEELCWHVDAATDEKGNWRARFFRSMQFIHLYLSHHDYLSDDGWHAREFGQPRSSGPAERGKKELEELSDFSDVQVMARGVEVAGVVQDEAGKPVAGAEVAWLEPGRSRMTFHHDLNTIATTDGSGRFDYANVRPGRIVVQVKAKGHAPGLVPVEAKANTPPLVIKLEPSRTLAGQVVDARGEPIAGAFVSIGSWRNFSTLGVFLKSGPDGRFRWDDAPADPILLTVQREGYKHLSFLSVSAGQELVVRLRRALSITGQVRDVKTKNAIPSAKVEVGAIDPKTGQFRWSREDGVFAEGGRLQAEVDLERRREFRLRFRAKGHQPFETRTFRADERLVDYDVDLTPGQELEDEKTTAVGAVDRPDGTPLEKAEVAIAFPDLSWGGTAQSAGIHNGGLLLDTGMNSVFTDDAGRFRVSCAAESEGREFAVVVVHSDYFAIADRKTIETNPVIKARPWGRIEGVARIGRKLAAGAVIKYHTERSDGFRMPYVSDGGETTADPEGRFVLNHVIPGEVRVSIVTGMKGNLDWFSSGTPLEVKDQGTTRVELGGKGRPVIARIAPPPGFDPKADFIAGSRFEISSDRPYVPYPSEFTKQPDDAREEWYVRWRDSPEGRAYHRTYFVLGSAKLQPDGTIRADDVPAGQYRLTLEYKTPPTRDEQIAPGRIARATVRFTIPKIPGGWSQEPFDLGELKPTVQ